MVDQTEKEVLRWQLQEQREQLTPHEIVFKSRRIISNALEAIAWPKIRTMHCFTTIAERNEIDTGHLFNVLWGRFPDLQTYSSQKIDGSWQQGQISKGKFTSLDRLPEIDVIFVPMLGFDDANHRLGYGDGWYDRFLAEQQQATKVGLCFELGRLEDLPVEPHDIALDLVITEAS